jgi:hypothetical protein
MNNKINWATLALLSDPSLLLHTEERIAKRLAYIATIAVNLFEEMTSIKSPYLIRSWFPYIVSCATSGVWKKGFPISTEPTRVNVLSKDQVQTPKRHLK